MILASFMNSDAKSQPDEVGDAIYDDPLSIRALALPALAPEERLKWIDQTASTLIERREQLMATVDDLRGPERVAQAAALHLINIRLEWLELLRAEISSDLNGDAATSKP